MGEYGGFCLGRNIITTTSESIHTIYAWKREFTSKIASLKVMLHRTTFKDDFSAT